MRNVPHPQVRLELQADGRDLAVLPVLLPEGGGQQQQQHGYGPGGSSTGRWSAPAAQNALDILAEDDLRGERPAAAPAWGPVRCAHGCGGVGCAPVQGAKRVESQRLAFPLWRS